MKDRSTLKKDCHLVPEKIQKKFKLHLSHQHIYQSKNINFLKKSINNQRLL